LVIGFALLLVMARYPLGAAVERGGKHGERGPAPFLRASGSFAVASSTPPAHLPATSQRTRYPSTQFCACATSSPVAQSSACGEGLGRKMVIAQRGTWARTRRWMWAGRGGRGGYDQLVVRNVRILPACKPLRRCICSLRAPKANARGPAEGAAGEASLIGGKGVAGAKARRLRRDMRGNRHVDGDNIVERRMEVTGL
jgi:hypothetical protein